jgi:zinc ribbon protein
MYCPKCAAQNQDQTKYCRSCGTDLKAIALVLNGQSSISGEVKDNQERERLKTQSDGIRELVQGVLLFGLSVLLGVALALFSNKKDWMIIWLIFCGWLAVLAAFILGAGLSKLIQSRMMSRRIRELAAPMTASAAIPGAETQRITEVEATPETVPPSSVSEHTTAPLVQPHPRA